MSAPMIFDRARTEAALRIWVDTCRIEFLKPHRYPGIDFNADFWPVKTEYKTKIEDISLAPTLDAFVGRKSSYYDAFRSDIAEHAIANKKKLLQRRLTAWRWLVRIGPECLHDLTSQHLLGLEAEILQQTATNLASAGTSIARLLEIAHLVDRITAARIVQPISWRISAHTKKTLRLRASQHQKAFRRQKAEVLDRQIEALSDAMRAMLKRDPRLNAYDRSALAAMGLLMCVPSRVNEPLCMSVDDTFMLDDYATRADDQSGSSALQRAHMLLLQKGSKGATWGGKPALTFMIDLANACIQVLTDGGKRSRMLAAWYENHPDMLYLPPELEHFRGQEMNRAQLWQIMNLTDAQPTRNELSNLNRIMADIAGVGVLLDIPNPRARRAGGARNSRHTVQAMAWEDLEKVLLRRIHKAMKDARRVTRMNSYSGRISKMLALIDTNFTPYLPRAIKYTALSDRCKQSSSRKIHTSNMPTVFEKLNLTLVVDGHCQPAWIETHDPRRWLTTQALKAKERLSDVLINKWANRLSIDQLKNYDLRSDAEKADHAAMPVVYELKDFSAGLQQLQGLEAQYGLETALITAGEAAISMTSMDAITNAIEDRPVARTANEVIVIYRTRYGGCVHQHHETPCRSYSGCGPCSNNLVVKGHLPTNEVVRKRESDLRRSIVTQIDKLVTAHNRGIADLPELLEEHMLAIIREGLSPEEWADDLIDKFHEVKNRIKSVAFKSKLEEAYVMRGYVRRLDSPEISSGALMRYHNRSRNAAPGHERALDARGGREAIGAKAKQFQLDHPEFASTALGLKDQRELLQFDGDQNDEDEDFESK